MENLKEKKIDFHACIFQGIKSACEYLEFRTSYTHSQKFHLYMHSQKKLCMHTYEKKTKINPKKIIHS